MAKKSKQQIETEKFMKIFFRTPSSSPDSWQSEQRFNVDKEIYSQICFIVDGYNEKLNIVWEYDGHGHYENEETIKKDKKREEYFISEKYTFIVIPYFCTLTRAATRHYLKKAFENEECFEEALNKNYDDAAMEAYGTCFPTPGWHGSQNVPFKFSEEGKKRFLRELDELPEETYHQIMHSLTLYLNNSLNKDIIEKIQNFKVKNEHIKNDWNFILEKKS